MNNNNALIEEWKLLQNQYDSYEKHSLLLKIVNIVIAAMYLLSHYFNTSSILFCLAIIATIWLQDGIWKTFQGRIETRLLQLEEAIKSNNELCAFQFNRSFLENRSSTARLILEYIKQSLRPTVAYPHFLLFILVLLIELMH